MNSNSCPSLCCYTIGVIVLDFSCLRLAIYWVLRVLFALTCCAGSSLVSLLAQLTRETAMFLSTIPVPTMAISIEGFIGRDRAWFQQPTHWGEDIPLSIWRHVEDPIDDHDYAALSAFYVFFSLLLFLFLLYLFFSVFLLSVVYFLFFCFLLFCFSAFLLFCFSVFLFFYSSIIYISFSYIFPSYLKTWTITYRLQQSIALSAQLVGVGAFQIWASFGADTGAQGRICALELILRNPVAMASGLCISREAWLRFRFASEGEV